MSKVFDTLSWDTKSAATWYLQLSEGYVYGPVAISVLREWAEQGRIVVGNLVSSDDENWVPAESVPELKMTWTVELRNGRRYGPFNLAAVPLLVQRGKLSRTATVQHCSTGELLSVASILRFGAAASLGGAVAGKDSGPASKEAASASTGVVEQSPAAAAVPEFPVAKPAKPEKRQAPVVPDIAPAAVSGPAERPMRESGGAPSRAGLRPDEERRADDMADSGVKERESETGRERAMPEAGQEESQRQAEPQKAEREERRGKKEKKPSREDEVLLASIERLEETVLAMPGQEGSMGQLKARKTPPAASAGIKARKEHLRIRIQECAELLQNVAHEAEEKAEEERRGTAREKESLERRLLEAEQVGAEQLAALRLRMGELQAEAGAFGARIKDLEADLNHERSTAAEAQAGSESREKALNDRIEQLAKELEGQLAHAGALEAEAGRRHGRIEDLEKMLAAERKMREAAAQRDFERDGDSAGRIAKLERELQEEKGAYAELETRSRGRELQLAGQITVLKSAQSGKVAGLETDLRREQAARVELESKVCSIDKERAAQVKRMEEEAEALGARIKDLEAELSRERNAAEAKAEGVDRTHAERDRAYEALRREISGLRDEIARGRKELEEERARAGSLEAEKGRQHGRIEDLEKMLAAERKLREAAAQMDVERDGDFAGRIAKLERELQEQQGAYAELETRSRGRELQLAGQVTVLKSAQSGKVAGLETELQREQAARAELESKVCSIDKERAEQVKRMQAEAGALGARIKDLETELSRERNAAAAKAEAAGCALDERNRAYETLRREMAGLKEEAARAMKALEEERARAGTLGTTAGGKQGRIKDLEKKLAAERKLREGTAEKGRAREEELAGQLAKLERALQEQREAYAELEARGRGRELEMTGQIKTLRAEGSEQLKALQSELQRERAERAEFESKVRDLEQELAGQVKRMETEAGAVGTRIAALEEELSRERKAAAEKEEAAGSELEERNRACEAFRQEITGLKEEADRAWKALEEERARAGTLEAAAGEKQGRIEDLEEKLAAERKVQEGAVQKGLMREEELIGQIAKIETRSRERELELSGQLTALKDENSTASAELESELRRQMATRAELESTVRNLEEQRAELIERLQAESSAVGAKVSDLEAQLSRERGAAEGVRKESSSQMEILNVRIDRLEKDLTESQNTIDVLRSELADANRAQEEMKTGMSRGEQELARARAEFGKAVAARVEIVQRFLGPQEGGEACWYMKREDEAAYGPVDLIELWNWACQCRVDSSHLLSQDGKTWVRAEAVPALRMEWVCDMPNGNKVGPLNPFAFRELVEEGVMGPENRVLNSLTGETITIGELLEATEDGMALQRKSPDPEVQAWKQRCKEAEEHGKRIEDELAREKNLLEAEQVQRRKIEQERSEQAERMRAEAGDVAARVAELEAEKRKERDSAEGIRKEASAQMATLTEQILKYEKDVGELQNAIAALRSELADAKRAQEETRADVAQGGQELERVRAELEKAVAARVELVQRFLGPQEGGEPGWYMKGENESVFGPADLSTLWNWACQCRIDPSDLVSRDKTTWIRAETIPELRMEWVCDKQAGGTLGPLNPFAFQELVKGGEVNLESPVRNRVTGETISVGELLKASEDGTALRRKSPEPGVQAWKQRCAEAEERGKRLEEELVSQKSLLEAEKTQRQKIEQELTSVREWRAELPSWLQQPAKSKGPAVGIPPRRLSQRFLAVAQAARDTKDTGRKDGTAS